MNVLTHLLAFMAGGTMGVVAMTLLQVAGDDDRW